MFTVSATAPLSEDGKSALTPDQLWDAMEHHIRTGDPRFVPPGHEYEMVSDEEDEVVRRAILSNGEQRIVMLQRVSMHAKRAMLMSTLSGPLNVRMQIIETDEHGNFILRIVHMGSVVGAQHNSAEEQALAVVRQKSLEVSAAKFVDTARLMVQQNDPAVAHPTTATV